MIPDLLKISGELVKTFLFCVSESEGAFLDRFQPFLGLVKFSECVVQPALKGISDEAVPGVDEVELFEGAVGFVLSGLNLQRRVPCLL